jgi:hypothetical protein
MGVVPPLTEAESIFLIYLPFSSIYLYHRSIDAPAHIVTSALAAAHALDCAGAGRDERSGARARDRLGRRLRGTATRSALSRDEMQRGALQPLPRSDLAAGVRACACVGGARWCGVVWGGWWLGGRGAQVRLRVPGSSSRSCSSPPARPRPPPLSPPPRPAAKTAALQHRPERCNAAARRRCVATAAVPRSGVAKGAALD